MGSIAAWGSGAGVGCLFRLQSSVYHILQDNDGCWCVK